ASNGSRSSFIATAVTIATGTITQTIARIFWNGTSWAIDELSKLGTTSNHPTFVLVAGAPAVKTFHTSTYTVRVVMESALYGGYGVANSRAIQSLDTRVLNTESSVTLL